MIRRAQSFASAALALACARCSALLYGEDFTGPSSVDAAVGETSSPDDARADDADADAGSSSDAPASDARDAFPDAATVFSGNGHAYEVVSSDGIAWESARLAAIARGGHLATITSAEENAFVYALADARPESWNDSGFGDIQGPWLGASRVGTNAPDAGWTWVTGEPFAFTAWASSEPNNGMGVENVLHFYAGANRGPTWNDIDGTLDLKGYVVEYE